MLFREHAEFALPFVIVKDCCVLVLFIENQRFVTNERKEKKNMNVITKQETIKNMPNICEYRYYCANELVNKETCKITFVRLWRARIGEHLTTSRD